MQILYSRLGASWCICKDGLGDAALQKTLDYACGAGADCNPTHQSGPCFNPNTVRAHCSYAVNSYFQRNRQLPTACDFSGTATIVNSDPSEFFFSKTHSFFCFLWPFCLPTTFEIFTPLDLAYNFWTVNNCFLFVFFLLIYRRSWLCLPCYCKVWTFCI